MIRTSLTSLFFFFNDTATTEIYTLSLHDALPISLRHGQFPVRFLPRLNHGYGYPVADFLYPLFMYIGVPLYMKDRKSTRLNSSHDQISYAVFCLKKKKISKYASTSTHGD